jgi:hypothetical protein
MFFVTQTFTKCPQFYYGPLIFFIRTATCVYIFKCTCIESFEWMLLILILNIPNGWKQKCTFDYNLGPHAIVFYIL